MQTLARHLRIHTLLLAGLGLGTVLGVAACDEEDDEIVACFYEERSSACGGGDYSDWESRCTEIENGQPCSAIIKSDTVCESTCCVDFQVQNLEEVPGASCE